MRDECIESLHYSILCMFEISIIQFLKENSKPKGERLKITGSSNTLVKLASSQDYSENAFNDLMELPYTSLSHLP